MSALRVGNAPCSWGSLEFDGVPGETVPFDRMLDELAADRVHLLMDGVIVTEGGPELARRLEIEGYDAWRP